MPNALIKLLELFPDKPWDWKQISKNPNINMNFVRKHPEFPWDWNILGRNPNITCDFIKGFIDKPWNLVELSYNKNISTASTSKYTGGIGYFITTWEDIPQQINEQSDLDKLSSNPKLTSEIVNSNEVSWNWIHLSNNTFKYDLQLLRIHKLHLYKIRENTILQLQKFHLCYNLIYMIKKQSFWGWYCGENGIGRKIDHNRIRNSFR